VGGRPWCDGPLPAAATAADAAVAAVLPSAPARPRQGLRCRRGRGAAPGPLPMWEGPPSTATMGVA